MALSTSARLDFYIYQWVWSYGHIHKSYLFDSLNNHFVFDLFQEQWNFFEFHHIQIKINWKKFHRY